MEKLEPVQGLELKPGQDYRPYFSDRTVHADAALTVEALKLIAEALPFRYSKVDQALGWKPLKVCLVNIGRDRSTGRWRVEGLQFRDQFFEILFIAAMGEVQGPVLMYQRGKEKQYASVDAILQDFRRIVGRHGQVSLNYYFNDDLSSESAVSPTESKD